MIYEEAAVLAAEHAPELHMDANVPGLQHVNFRKEEGGPLFSIMLPVIQGEDSAQQEREMFLSGLRSAKAVFGA